MRYTERPHPLAFALLLLLSPTLSAQTLDDARRLQAAGRLEAAVRAYRAVAKDPASDLATAATARNDACVVLTGLGNYREALTECRQALKIRRTLGDEPGMARTLADTGLTLHYLGQDREAEPLFRDALEIHRKHGNAEGQVLDLSNLGLTATSLGHDARALALHRRAAEIAEAAVRRPGEPWAADRLRTARMVELLAGLDEREPGAGHAERALEIAQRAKVRELLDALRRARRSPDPLQAADLRGRIGDGVLLEYFRGERSLYLWVVHGDGIRMADLGPAAPVLATNSSARVGSRPRRYGWPKKSSGPTPGGAGRSCGRGMY